MDFAVTPSMVERKTVCTNCKRVFRTGDRFAERPLDWGLRVLTVEVICVPCSRVVPARSGSSQRHSAAKRGSPARKRG